MRISLIVHFMVSYLLFTTAVSAQLDVNAISESIVKVRAYDRNKPIAEGSGFVINAEGYVLTNAHLLTDAKRLTVVSLKTGAEIVAKQVFTRRDMNLGLLHVQGLGLPALNLSEQGAAIDRDVLTLKLGAADSVHIAQGKIATHRDVTGTRTGDPVIHLLTHTAIVTSRAFGMPLFNECGDVVAINRPNPARGRWPFRKNAEPESAVFALRSGDIITALKDRAIAHQVVEEACLSASERAAADSIKAIADSIQKARAQADSVKMAVADSIKAVADSIKAEADRVKAEAIRIKAVADRVKAEKARTDAANRLARARADSTKQAAADIINVAKKRVESEQAARLAAERAKARADSINWEEQQKTSQQLKWIVIGGAGLVVIVLLSWLASSRRKKAQLQNTASRLREAEQEAKVARQTAADAPQTAPFNCILEGQDNAGRPFALRISALALGDQAGVTLGRSADRADFVIDHESVSREHVRLTCTGGIYIEDLNALNGTKVNGRTLNPHEPMLLQDNDQLELGPVVFNVRLIKE